MNALSNLSVNAVILAINFELIGSLLAISVALAFRLARNVHPRVRYAIAVAAFFAAVILPVLATFQVFERGERSILTVRASENEISQNAVRENNGLSVRPILEEPLQTAPISDETPIAGSFHLTVSPQFLTSFVTLWFVI